MAASVVHVRRRDADTASGREIGREEVNEYHVADTDEHYTFRPRLV